MEHSLSYLHQALLPSQTLSLLQFSGSICSPELLCTVKDLSWVLVILPQVASELPQVLLVTLLSNAE